jgi:hypothetical protein
MGTILATLPMGDGAPDPAAVVVKMPTLFANQPIEEQPAGTLVDAVALVARAVTAKIAYHQSQIDALRRALRPFNEMSKHGEIPGSASGSDEAVDQLLAIARKLGDGG